MPSVAALDHEPDRSIPLIVKPAPALGSMLMSAIVGKWQQPSGGIRLDGAGPNVPVKFEKVTSSDAILPGLFIRSASETPYVSPTMQKGIRMMIRKTVRIKRIIAPPNTVPRKENYDEKRDRGTHTP